MQQQHASRLISLAAGVLPEASPTQRVHAAAEAGFRAAGIWCEADSWAHRHTRELENALAETGLCALDIEVVWLHPGEADDRHDRFVDIALEIGARNILCVSSEPDHDDTCRRLTRLCRRVEGSATRVVLEFLSLTCVQTLDQALQIVRRVDHPAAGILVDALHLQRNGSCPMDLAALEPHLLPYLQLCDASASPLDSSAQGLLEDALYQRKLPGEGELPLPGLLDAVAPDTPLSLEIRSRLLAERFPDFTQRAKHVQLQCSRYLALHDAPGRRGF